MAAASASIVSSTPSSKSAPTPGMEVDNAKVKARSRAARKEKGKDAPLEMMFGATWGKETFEIPHSVIGVNHQSGSPTGCLKNLRLQRNRRNMNARSLAPVLGQWHPDLRAWIEVGPHAWQPLSRVSMRPWTCCPRSWVQAMKSRI